MAAAITFYAGSGNAELNDLSTPGSGLGFYGASFGTSVQVGQYQETTFITNSNGSVNGGNNNNNKYLGNMSGVELNGAAAVVLSGLTPSSDASVNIRFTNDTAVRTQNVEARVFDRTNKDNDPSGVTCQVAELLNGASGTDQAGAGSGSAEVWVSSEHGWQALAGSGTVLTLLSSAGSGGLSPNGNLTTDTRHDWYLALSATPTSIGSKTQFGLFCELEFL